jgi:hypothetical protein
MWSNDYFLFFSSVLSPRRCCSHKIPAPTILNLQTLPALGSFLGRAGAANSKAPFSSSKMART